MRKFTYTIHSYDVRGDGSFGQQMVLHLHLEILQSHSDLNKWPECHKGPHQQKRSPYKKEPAIRPICQDRYDSLSSQNGAALLPQHLTRCFTIVLIEMMGPGCVTMWMNSHNLHLVV